MDKLFEVSVAGQKIPVYLCHLSDNHGMLDEKGIHPQIKINRDLSAKDRESILAHELLHAVFRLSGWTEILTSEQEEGLVVLLENYFVPAWEIARAKVRDG